MKALGLFLVLTSSLVFGQAPVFPVASTPEELSPLMERELRGCFDFFWEEWNAEPESPTYGMTNGDYVGMNKYSPLAIEEQGFYFTAIIIGVERGWITRKEGEERRERGRKKGRERGKGGREGGRKEKGEGEGRKGEERREAFGKVKNPATIVSTMLHIS